VNSFQLLSMWIVGIAVGAGCLWLLMWAWQRRRSQIDAEPGLRPYQINGPFVEICVADGCSLADLRALFESIRDDPTLPSEPLLLFDGSARKEVLSDTDVRTRLAVFLDIFRPRVPVFAVVVSSAMVASAQASQRYAAAAGVRVELFPDFEPARGWLAARASTACRS